MYTSYGTSEHLSGVFGFFGLGYFEHGCSLTEKSIFDWYSLGFSGAG